MESNPESEPDVLVVHKATPFYGPHTTDTFSDGLEGGVEGPSPPIPAEHGGSGGATAEKPTLYCTRSRSAGGLVGSQVTGNNPSVQVTGNRFPQRTERQRGSQSLTLSLLYIMKPALGMRTYRKKHKPQPHTKYGMSVAHIYGTRACKYTHTFTPDIGFLWQPCMKHTHTDQHWPAVWMRVDHSSLILFHWFSGSI